MQPDPDVFAARHLLDADQAPPVQVEHGRVEPVGVRGPRVPLEEEVHGPGGLGRVRDRAQILGHGEGLLPAVPPVEEEEGDGHEEHESIPAQ